MPTAKTERTNLFPLRDDEYLTQEQFNSLPVARAWQSTVPEPITRLGRVWVDEGIRISYGGPYTRSWWLLAHDAEGNLVKDQAGEPSKTNEMRVPDEDWYFVDLDGSAVSMVSDGYSFTAVASFTCADGDTIIGTLVGWDERAKKRNLETTRIALTAEGRERMESWHKGVVSGYEIGKKAWDEALALPQILMWTPRPKALQIALEKR